MTDTTFVQGTIIEPTWLQDANDHVNDKTGIKHAASKISNTPSGNISATTVQAAIDELDLDKQPSNANLTALTTAASQAEMEAGTEVALRAMSPVRVAQAITALGSVKVKTVSFTRDVSLASGTQTITGIGFTPKVAIFFMVGGGGGTNKMSMGVDDGITPLANIDYSPITTDMWDHVNSSIYFLVSVGNYTTGVISSFNSDGFVISWTKTGSPTGTASVRALVIG